MKILKQLLWLTGAFILFFSCKKEKSVEGGTDSVSTQWQFKDSAILFNGKMDTAYRQTTGSISSVILEGTSSDGTSDFYLEIFGANITTGVYKNPYVQFTYIVSGSVLYENVPANTDKFSVTITNIDANGITGTFSGEVEDVLGKTKTITSGTFTGTFNGTTPSPSGSGQLTLWSKQGCGGTGPISVKVQSQTGTITSFHNTAPACGAVGAASFTLPAAAYTWEAYCAGDTARGNVTITSGSCSTAEVIFNAASTNCIISNLAYYDAATNAKQGSLSSFFNASNQVNNILFVDSNTNSTVYRFTPAKSGTRINIDAQQYFTVDASGRITDFHGFVDATDTSLPKIVITYTFNAAGNLTKAAYAFDAAPTTNILNINYTWTSGNLTKAVVQQVGATEKVEYDYQYDASKTAKNFLCFFPSTEIFWVQSAINYGKNSNNILTASTIKYYDATGNVVTDNATYSNYVIDTNNYVKSFSILGDGSVLPGDTKYVVSYKCF